MDIETKTENNGRREHGKKQINSTWAKEAQQMVKTDSITKGPQSEIKKVGSNLEESFFNGIKNRRMPLRNYLIFSKY